MEQQKNQKSGFCNIYKKAIFKSLDGQTKVIDYSNGLQSFKCNVKLVGDQHVYEWNLLGNVIEIPVNIPRNDTSIIKNGTFDIENQGTIYYEFIFGKYYTNADHFMHKYSHHLLYLILIIILLYVIFNRMNKEQKMIK
jgi:hypothetical protein